MAIKSAVKSEPKFKFNCITLLLTVAFQLLAERASLSVAWATTTSGSPLAPGTSGNYRQHHYFGTLIGQLNKRDHNVSGEVFAVDEQTLFIKNFNYDGLARDAYFWSSVSAPQPAALDGFIVPDEKGSTKPLERYTDKDVVLRLPEGRTLREINWLSVWSRQTKQNLGEILIPSQNLVIPRPLEIGSFSQLAHGLKSGPITIVDAQTFLVPDFHYDGLGPAAYFWLTRGSQGLTATGLRLKDENGSGQALKKYTGETVVITLPEELTIYDFDWFGVWCKEFQVNFGQTRIPQQAKVPPSPKMLGIKPENKLNCEILYDDLGYEIRWVLDGDDIVMQLVGKIEPGEYMAFGLGKDDSRSDMQNADAVVTWVDRSSGQVHAIDYYLGAKQQCHQAAVDSSSSSSNSDEPSAAPTTSNNQETIAQVSFTGSCPDSKLPGGGDSLTLLHGAIVNGYSMVTFKRPQLGIDELYDQHVYSDGQQSVLWAIGTLNAKKEIGYHRLKTRANMFIDFARNPQWNCPIPDLNATMHTSPSHLPITSASQVDPTVVNSPAASMGDGSRIESSSMAMASAAALDSQRVSAGQPQVPQPASRLQAAQLATTTARQQPAGSPQVDPTNGKSQSAAMTNSKPDQPDSWFIPAIVCPSDRTFYAQIGPTGGHKGYEALTGRTSWGVSWYVNGLMIPELVVERGQTYRFVVEGGSDKTSATRRHPFYLTDSAEGGFDFKTDDERIKERIFGGVALRGDGQFVPTAEGRLCEWKQTNSTFSNPDLYNTFAAYQRSLRLDCLPGQASMLKFAPDANTPDLIYYQCYTHRFMGWRIRVVNSCSGFVNSLSRSGTNNNTKRDLKKSHKERSSIEVAGNSEERPMYNRRSLAVSSSPALADSIQMVPSEPRMSIQELSNQAQFMQEFQPDNSELMTTESLPGNMLILNNSQLIQRQPYNLSSFDEIVKLSPADLEFIDQQPDGPIEPYLAAAFNQQFALQALQNYSQPTLKPSENKTTKSPKTLQSYIRRLASIYYPMQQQLTSMLASQSLTTSGAATTGGSTGGGQAASAGAAGSAGSQSAASQQSPQTAAQTNGDQSVGQSGSSFLLSNLVPKSKIDLSKSTISKKLNKLRFKSGRKYELQQARPSQPPTPANEFNYDIFNNQLAQLEKQQKQLQSLEMAASWPIQQQQQQLQSDSFNYLPMMTVTSEEQQAIDSMNSPRATQILLGNLQQPQVAYNPHLHLHNMGGSKQPMMANTYQQQQQQQRYPPPRQPLRYSEIPLGPPNNLGQQPYVIDYLSMMFNRTAEPPIGGQMAPPNNHESGWPTNQVSYQFNNPANNRQQQAQHQRPNSRPSAQQQEHHHHHQQQQQYQQPAIYITRLPQPLSYPMFEAVKSHASQQQQQQQQHQQQTLPQDSRLWPNNAARYPGVPPYANNQKVPAEAQLQALNNYPTTTNDYSATNQMSTMPSVALTIHDTLENNGAGYAGFGVQGQPEVESLSGSGSGSHYDFRQQPSKSDYGNQVTLHNNLMGGSSISNNNNIDLKTVNHNPSRFQQSPELDHMLAIERFSKQSSERRLPSIVHPVTGEHVHLPATLVDFESNANQQRNNQLQAANISGSQAALPRRFSALLIDKHLVSSSSEPTVFQANELIDVDQTTRAGDLQRINTSETNADGSASMAHQQQQQQQPARIVLISSETDPGKIHQRVGSSFNNLTNQQQTHECNGAAGSCNQQSGQPTTESVAPVLVKPNNFDYYPESSQPSTSSTPSSLLPTTTTMISTSTEGPLTPSLGPPTVQRNNNNNNNNNDDSNNKLADDDLVLKSTLIEPITSTLMHTPSVWPVTSRANSLSNHNQVNQFNFDTNPFTPIELTNPLYYPTNPQQFAASNLLSSRLRPPFIESMLSQNQSPFRPEPPVQVASYLAQHLTSHSPMFISSERSVASNQPVALSVSIPSSSDNQGQQQQQQQQQQQATFTQNSNNLNSNENNHTNNLIILKPAVLAKQSPQTYLLKPEYLTNHFKLVGGEASSSANSADLYYTNEIGEPTTRRLAGNQFDRLSSLSSPPSTSIALDPMQAANTMASYVRHGHVNESQVNDMLKATSNKLANQDKLDDSNHRISVAQPLKQSNDNSNTTTTIVVEATSGTGQINIGADKLTQHRQTTYLPSKPIPFSFETSSSLSSSNSDGNRLNPSGDSSINNLYRDNNTDNAILSHVMSLISSNAIPTPPLIPVNSYSSADYFLPTSDRFHRSLRG